MTNSQLDTTNESQEVSLFPVGDHKAHINRRANSKQCPQREKGRKIFKIENTISFPDARKQHEQFNQAKTYSNAVKRIICNILHKLNTSVHRKMIASQNIHTKKHQIKNKIKQEFHKEKVTHLLILCQPFRLQP